MPERTLHRPTIDRLAAYTPGEQPGAGTRVIKLNTNENPYPPGDAVMEAVRAVTPDELRRYPSPDARAFREKAASLHRLDPECIIATNGGDELLRLAVTVFCEPTSQALGKRSGSGASRIRGVGSGARPDPDRAGASGAVGGLGVAEPSYSLYPVLAAIHDTALVRVELNNDFSLPEELAARWNEAGCRLAFLVNPHAPSGRVQPVEELRRVAEAFEGVLLVDEAYIDFAGEGSDALPLIREGMANVLVLRSLSKGYSLAGLRFGYGLGDVSLIAAMHKARDSYNVDTVAQRAAVAALTHRDRAAQTWKAVRRERSSLSEALKVRGWDVLPSGSNFLLCRPPGDDRRAKRIYEKLKAEGILVRWFDADRLRDRLRISIGTPEEVAVLLAAIERSP